jgi:hypothetical protein
MTRWSGGPTAGFDIDCPPRRVAERQWVTSSRARRRPDCQGGRPDSGAPYLDAILVDPRDAKKEVVATSLLTLAASFDRSEPELVPQERFELPTPSLRMICPFPTRNDSGQADPTEAIVLTGDPAYK